DVHAWLCGWDYAAVPPLALRLVAEHFPASLNLLRRAASPTGNVGHALAALAAPRRLARQLGLHRKIRVIGLPHHDCHAAFSWAASPFARSEQPVLVSVLDGYGEEGAISLFVAEGGRLRCLRKNYSIFDSLGAFYSVLSSTQGGWTPLSSEGRYM